MMAVMTPCTWHSSQTSPSPHLGSAESRSSSLGTEVTMGTEVTSSKRPHLNSSCLVATGTLKIFSLALFMVPRMAPRFTCA